MSSLTPFTCVKCCRAASSTCSLGVIKKPPEGGLVLFNIYQASALNHLGFTPILTPVEKLIVLQY